MAAAPEYSVTLRNISKRTPKAAGQPALLRTLCQKWLDTLSENRVLGVQKSTRRLEISTSTAKNSARRAQNREKPLGFSRYAEPQLNLGKAKILQGERRTGKSLWDFHVMPSRS